MHQIIADSGATKTLWTILKGNAVIAEIYSSGINPFFMEKEEIIASIKSTFKENYHHIDTVYFYGAGCANDAKKKMVGAALCQCFEAAKVIVENDLLASARATCKQNAGISCILGTGSNSCEYNGQQIIKNVAPLGYILGDEGSGAAIGKRFLGDLLKGLVSEELRTAFYKTYSYEYTELLEAVYRQKYPNRFLAQFSKFVYTHIQTKSMHKIVYQSFDDFIKRNVMQYKSAEIVKVNFTGSVAFYFSDILETVLKDNHLQLGVIHQTPMQGLIAYHTSK